MSVADIREPEDITAELLTELLQHMAPGTVVTDTVIHRTHQGTASHVHLDATYGANPKNLPARLFVKTQLNSVKDLPATHAETQSEGGAGSSLLRDETIFYRDLRPNLEVETLDVYVSELVKGPAQFIIVAENVTDRGARFPDPAIPMAVDEVAALMRTLAQFHAQFWNSPRLDTELKWVQRPLEGDFHDFLHAGAFDIINALLDAPYKVELLKQAGLDKALLEAAFHRLQEEVAKPPITLLHGDTHPGNLYVMPDGSVGLLDWQLLRCGSWAHDVCYGMVGALSPQDRRANEEELLRLYLSELAVHGVKQPPTFEEAWFLHRCSPPWGFAMWAITPEEMYSVAAVGGVMDRFGAAFVDLKTRDALGV